MSEITTRVGALSPAKRALLEKRLQSAAPSESIAEPIAIIGMGCRFPGGATSIEQFWSNLVAGVDAITPVPLDRWNNDAFCNPGTATAEELGMRWGGFVKEAGDFDPGFFGISPKEALRMDPQQRMLLEVAWEALEAAGIPAESLGGSATGVFVGVQSQSTDYYFMQLADINNVEFQTNTGGAHSIIANRLSYFLDLRGPSFTVDTACSSSLVALHVACQSLRTHECALAFVGGTNLMAVPETSMAYTKLTFLAPDGRCKTFDSRANGFVRGEGCGVVLLRRLSDAIRNKDPIVALIRGTAVNQDGTTNGLTAPSGLAQQAVIRTALRNGGVQPSQISYIETHGTGTSLGDPIEVEALAAVVGATQQNGLPCYLGALKSHIGHLESAAGIAGLIKTALCLRHRYIVPNLHFKTLNPHIVLDGTRFVIPTGGQQWDSGAEARLAGVSSFGFGGTNGHAILQEAPEPLPMADAAEPVPPERILTISARNRKALAESAEAWITWLQADQATAVTPRDIAYSACRRRSHLPFRLSVVGRTSQEWVEGLVRSRENHAFCPPEAGRAGIACAQAEGECPRLVFVFSGQGPQWPGMGQELFEQEPVYRRMIEQCSLLLTPYTEKTESGPWNLLDELTASPEQSRLQRTEIAQPAIFALQMALCELWKSWGVSPSAVIGHSIGEVAAACVAGVLTLEDAIRVVYHRSRLMQRASGQGEMAAVGLSPEQAAAEIRNVSNQLVIAAINSPNSVVLSGDSVALDHVLGGLQQRGIFNRKLAVNYAFHSPLMEPYQAELAAALAGIRPQPARLPVLSTVTGQPVVAADYDAAYWARNIREPVRFADAVGHAATVGNTFLEIGPHPVLGTSISQCLVNNQDATMLTSLRRGSPERASLLTTLGMLYAQGYPIDWKPFYPGEGRWVALPPYPWQHARYWLDSGATHGQLPLSRHGQNHSDQTGLLGRILPQVEARLEDQADPSSLVLDIRLRDESGLVLAESLGTQPQIRDRNALLRSMCQHAGENLYRVDWVPKARCPRAAGGVLDGIEAAALRQSLNGPTSDSPTVRNAEGQERVGWLLLADRSGLADALVARLGNLGQVCIQVLHTTNASEKNYNGRSLKMDGKLTEFQQLVQSLNDYHEVDSWNVVHCWGLDVLVSIENHESILQQSRTICCESAVYLAQALHGVELGKPARLWLVTQGAEPTNNPFPNYYQAPLWGVGRTLAFEMSAIWGGLVDLSPEVDVERMCEELMDEIRYPDKETQVALRESGRFVPRFGVVESVPQTRAGALCLFDGAYLVTGNVNGLGLRVARWLAQEGARHVVLVGKVDATTTGDQDQIHRAIHNMGVNLKIVEGDPADHQLMSSVFAGFGRSWPALKGIVHAASIVDPHPIGKINPLEIERTFRESAGAAWQLHSLSADMKVDFFVMFSSASAIMGARDLAHQGAATHLLDGLAHYRLANGMPALSVNWGWWPEGGTTKELDAYYPRIGLSPISSEEAFHQLGVLMRGNLAQVTVADINWQVFKPVCEVKGPIPFLENIAANEQAESREAGEQETDFRRLWSKTPPEERWDALVSHVRQHLAYVLGFEDADNLDIKEGFFSMGMDSITTLQFTDRLRQSIGHAFPATLAFEYPNLESLCAHIANDVLSDGKSSGIASSAESKKDGGTLGLSPNMELSEDELLQLLEKKLSSLNR